MISKPIKVKALNNFKIYITFEDGTNGDIDLSGLKGKGVFTLWDDYKNFEKVYIDNETYSIAWNKQVEIDATNLYLQLIGKSFEEWKNEHLTHAR